MRPRKRASCKTQNRAWMDKAKNDHNIVLTIAIVSELNMFISFMKWLKPKTHPIFIGKYTRTLRENTTKTHYGQTYVSMALINIGKCM